MDKKTYKKLGKKRIIAMHEEAELKAKTAVKMADEVKAKNIIHEAKRKEQKAIIKKLEAENEKLKSEIIENGKTADEAKSLGEEALDILDATKVLKNQAETSKKEVDTKAKENTDELLNLQKVKKSICKLKESSLYKMLGDSVDEAIQAGRHRNKNYGVETERLEKQIHNCDMIEKYLNLLRNDLEELQ